MSENTYIWINPVTAGLYAREDLDALLRRHRCTQVHCTSDWAETVKQKYLALAAASSQIIADSRCPMAAQLVRDASGSGNSLSAASVEPILIHAARELSVRDDLRGRPKLITTPCSSLADLGNRLALRDTRFIPWKALLREWGEAAPVSHLKSSPIPPGFFDSTGLRIRKITGSEEIAAYISGSRTNGEQLVEMLYCKDGCHNGDGVLFDE